ncbi:MAG: hypothetical protein Q4A41_05975, partial [Bacillota bacterium]|nr:hypothetical protein [Bacillota bacterium]
TEMIIDNPYRDKKEIVSFLSDGSERRIYNGLSIQVQSTSNPKIQKMRFATGRMNGIQGVPMKLELEATDQSFRNYPLTNQNVVYESLGLEGKFENGTFIPSTSGTGVISATVDGVKAYTDVRVSERIQQLIAVENQGFYQFYLESADGYRVRIGSEDVTAYIDGGIAEYRQEEGRIVPLKDNVAGYVTFSYDISARDTVTTNSPLRFGKINNRLEDFESHSVNASNAKKINIQIVDNPTNAGKAGAVRYKKSLVSGSKDMKYFPAELTVEKGRNRVLFDMYSEKKADIYVELMVLDEKGVGRFVKVTDSIDRTGWQTYTMEDLHEGDRIYLIAVSSQDEGTIYFDNFRYDDEQGSDYIPRDINYVKDYKDYRIQSDGEVFGISYQSEMKEEQLKRLTKHFHYLEIDNAGGYIRAHDGFAQWRLLLDTLENARRPVLVKFSGTYYFPDKKAMDLLFRYVESCPQPVYMVFQAYEDLTDIFMYRKAHVIELKKKTEELQISEDLQIQISDLQLQEKKND